MSTQTAIFTVLPRGRSVAGYELSVYVSPRLEGGATLADFEAFTNWPRTLRDTRFHVFARRDDSTGDGTRVAALDLGSSSVVNRALWDAVFANVAVVAPGVQQLADLKMRSFSTREVRKYLDELYEQVATANPRSFPTLRDQGPIHALATTCATVGSSINSYRKNRAKDPGAQSARKYALEARNRLNQDNIEGHLFDTWLFYNRSAPPTYVAKDARKPSRIPPPLSAPEFDFHQVLAALGDHPALLRQLGIVLDFTLQRELLDAADPALLRAQDIDLRVEVSCPDLSKAEIKGPWTRCEPTAFLARPKHSSDIVNGYLKLDSGDYDVFNVDLDGTSLKAFDFGLNMTNLAAHPERETPSEVSLPSRRTGGFTVTRNLRQEELKQHFADGAANAAALENADTSVVLFADDVLRGYRVDVSTNAGPWRSLCKRDGHVSIPGYGAVELPTEPATTLTSAPSLPFGEDEGYVKATSGSRSLDPDEPPDMYLHEAVFGWDGFSLVAQRPGRAIASTPIGGKRQELARQAQHGNFRVNPVIGAASGTLPRLRFGNSYKFRVRTVDIAGNSLHLNMEGAPTTAPSSYLRHEPVAPPTLVLRAPITAGESLEHLVIRSYVSDGADAGEAANVDADPALQLYNALNERHIAPPKTSQDMAEKHGLFDVLFKQYANGDADAAKLALWLGWKEQGTFLDRKVLNEISGMLEDVVGLVPIPAPGAAFQWPVSAGDTLPAKQYVTHTAAQLRLPYLPDPLAVGVLLQGIAADDQTQAVRFASGDAGWPDVKPFRLRLTPVAGETAASDPSAQPAVSMTPLSGQLQQGQAVTIQLPLGRDQR
jgi:hypothetical protein